MSNATDSTNKESLGQSLGRISNGVYIVTLGEGQSREGMLATWVAQAAFEPPMLTIAVNKERHILQSMKKGTKFVLNALSKKSNDEFKAFLKPMAPGEDRFSALNTIEKNAGGPVLGNALSYLACTVKEQMEAGDHVVLLAEISSGEMLNANDEPMLHTRKNGFQY